jgi:hypothetical protein
MSDQDKKVPEGWVEYTAGLSQEALEISMKMLPTSSVLKTVLEYRFWNFHVETGGGIEKMREIALINDEVTTRYSPSKADSGKTELERVNEVETRLIKLRAIAIAANHELDQRIPSRDPNPKDGPCLNCGGTGCKWCDARKQL